MDNCVISFYACAAAVVSSRFSRSAVLFLLEKSSDTIVRIKKKSTRKLYTFLGWARTRKATTPEYTDQKEVKNLVTTQGGELILYAVWRPDSFQVTLNPNGGRLNGADQSVTATLRYGETCETLPTPTKYGYDFVGWN